MLTQLRRTNAHTSRSGGQALLLAVLIMVLLSLLGAAFITLISYNLSQTARYEDILAAKKMAQSGLEYVDDMLTTSDDGADWRPGDQYGPADNATAMAERVLAVNNYYDPVERARGWATSGDFVKYPNPNSGEGDFDGGAFLVKVEYNPTPGDPLSKHLKITSIGRSSNNPNAFYQMVGYKALPLMNYARFATGWDTTADTLSSTTPTHAVGFTTAMDWDGDNATTLAVASTGVPSSSNRRDVIYVPRGAGFGSDDYVTVDDGAGNTETRKITNVYVPAPDAAGADNSRKALLLDSNLPDASSFPVGSVVTKVADATGTAVDENSDGDEEKPEGESPVVRIDGPVRMQGDLGWAGRVLISLREQTAADLFLKDDKVEVSGSVGQVDANTPDDVRIRWIPAAGSATTTAVSVSSAGIFDSLGGRYIDGAGRTTGSTAGANDMNQRWVEPLAPPVIFDPANNWTAERYERLTRLSDNTKFTDGGGASHTYGECAQGDGIYLDNGGDLQWAMATLATRLTNLQTDWLTADPADPTGAYGTTSWWQNNQEYVPPGAQILLRSDAVLPDGTDLDATSATVHPSTGAPHRNGVPILWIVRTDTAYSINHATGTGTTVAAGTPLTYDYPANGILYAEGNVRIKGALGDDLVVVSKGTLYIEGSIASVLTGTAPNLYPTYHVGLFAREHVCVNTTQFQAKPFTGTDPVTDPAAEQNGDSFWQIAAGETLTREVVSGPPLTGGTYKLVVRHSGQLTGGLNIRYRSERTGAETSAGMTVNDDVTNATPSLQYRLKTEAPQPATITSPELNIDLTNVDYDALTELADALTHTTGDNYDGAVWNGMGAVASKNLATVPGVVPIWFPAGSYYYPIPVKTLGTVSCNAGTAVLALGGDTAGEMTTAYGTRNAVFYQPPDWVVLATSPVWSTTLSTQRGHRTRQLPDGAGGLTVGTGAGEFDATLGAVNQLAFGADSTAPAGYRLSRFKLEHLDGGYPTQGMEVTIHGVVYAQEGSWFIIPGQYFDDTLANSTSSPLDATRERRYNYAIKVWGAVVEKETADPGTTATETGMAQYKWTEKWSWPEHVADIEADWRTGAAPGTPPAGFRWTGPQYQYDYSLRQRDPATGKNPMPKLPVHSGLAYVSHANA